MTPHDMARERCANFVDSGCISVRPAVHREGVCVLGRMQERCTYFEKAVLPLVDRMPRYAGVRNQYRDAVKIGAKDSASPVLSMEEDRRCPCGKVREARHRYCPECGAKRRRELARDRVRKHRQGREVPV
ncbi:MAG: hypothetical protein ACLQVA_08120 [Candidatus Brocadiia bacterium]